MVSRREIRTQTQRSFLRDCKSTHNLRQSSFQALLTTQHPHQSSTMMRQVLYTKLFIVMGIAWIFECVHHLVHSDHHHCGHAGLELIFRLIGCLNLLRGSLIFFIFVCKDSILDKVCYKYLLKYLDRVSIH